MAWPPPLLLNVNWLGVFVPTMPWSVHMLAAVVPSRKLSAELPDAILRVDCVNKAMPNSDWVVASAFTWRLTPVASTPTESRCQTFWSASRVPEYVYDPADPRLTVVLFNLCSEVVESCVRASLTPASASWRAFAASPPRRDNSSPDSAAASRDPTSGVTSSMSRSATG